MKDMNVISAVILCVLAVVGACAVIKEISLRLFRIKADCSVMLITPVDSAEDAELVLRSAAARLKWGRSRADCAVCLDCDIDEKTRKICETVCREYGFLRLMTKKELKEELHL